MIWRATGRVGPHLRKLYNQGSSIGLAVPGLALQFFLGEVHFNLILTSPTAKVPFNTAPIPYAIRILTVLPVSRHPERMRCGWDQHPMPLAAYTSDLAAPQDDRSLMEGTSIFVRGIFSVWWVSGSRRVRICLF
jgi:hypothetical protein